mmetsp:Transcript_8735/g.14324  ORF Transcript_8735/g.14324 Transcript_8735/m.14324 type:complete len:237 (-) Transcript_8735:291-1001(-)|eukprot:CAMPEP_0184655584 /NCGR_PEP_ID=MMETSP0308-20130426/13694_1 /TAXON_ID=38269 /ORGANISM="Gloeochaete witrockiana, Strain SAG 46.84" /LENGTH=236 /DNA_ID=CAMNT_0027092145 /DNA_START=38 /DNA_END=748 /DNA_ORIENTATION=+
MLRAGFRAASLLRGSGLAAQSLRAEHFAAPLTSVPQRHSSSSAVTTTSGPINELTYGVVPESLQRQAPGENRRNYTYFVIGTARFAYLTFTRLVALKVITTMSASADVLALASLEVDIGNLNAGQSVTVKWRGKPVFIRHRTSEEIAMANAVDIRELRHQQTDAERVVNPDYLVMLGVCTHLGCVPIGGAGDYHGWFCPCHGSHYDTSGRIRKGPAPLNLEVPPYKFLSDSTIMLG